MGKYTIAVSDGRGERLSGPSGLEAAGFLG